MKKKVLFLIHTLGVGGAEKVLVNLVNNMDKHQYDVTLMTVIDTGIFKESLHNDVTYKTMFHLSFLEPKKKTENSDSGSLHSNYGGLKSTLKSMYQFFWRHINTHFIYKMYIKDSYDYEVAFLEGVATKIIASSTNEKSKKYAWIHVDLINERKSEKFYISNDKQKEEYTKFDKVICVSNIVKEQAIKKLNLRDDNTITIYNPIDTREIIDKSNKLETTKENKITFCTVGRLAPQKGYDRLLKVANKLRKEGFDFCINILGEGPDKQQLEDLIKQYDLNDLVYLLGFQSNPYPYIKNCDVFICPSRAEGFSTVASEAVVLHKPCLVTNCSGMNELFGDNSEYGYIVANDEEGIYDGMKKFILNQELQKIYSQKSKENSKRFNLEEAIKNIEKELFDETEY